MSAPPALPVPGPVHTERLVLRLVEPGDLRALHEVNGDPAVTAFLPYPPWRDGADAEAWLARMQGLMAGGGTLQFVLAARPAGRAIGTCVLFGHDAVSGRAEVGYALGRAHWGRGLMAEGLRALVGLAFGPLGLRRLEAEVDALNLPSARLLDGQGFAREGLLRQRRVGRQGELKDMLLFGRLNTDPAPALPDAAGSCAGPRPC